MTEQVYLQRVLRERFQAQKAKNPAVSLRGFAKRTGISVATLSLVLNGRRRVSAKLIREIGKRLLLDPVEQARLESHIPERWKVESDELENGKKAMQLAADQYQVVADWRAYAILGLVEMPGFQNKVSWIAERLGCSKSDVQSLLQRLKRLEMLVETKDGMLRRKESRYRTTDDVANLSLRKSHVETLELATESLRRDSVDARDFTWLTLPVNTKRMREAKNLIRKFQQKFLQTMDDDSAPDEVYRLAIQFFPLTKLKEKDSV